jgi:hypothetical protein
METIKISDESYTRLGVHANGFETPDSVITRLLDFFDHQGMSELPAGEPVADVTQQGRSYSKYQFEGELYGKGRLVLAVVKAHCEKHSDLSLDGLKDAYPDTLQGSVGVVTTISKALEIVERSPKKQKRHFIKPEELISVADGDIAVCTEWGSGNIDNFIERARLHGFDIQQVDGE